MRDEEIRALKDQIFRQDEEITNLVVALTDLRKQNVNQKEEHRSKEYSLNMQLQKFHKVRHRKNPFIHSNKRLQMDCLLSGTGATEKAINTNCPKSFGSPQRN